MEQFYQLCAVVGGTIFVGQFVLSVVGLGGDHDLSGDTGGRSFRRWRSPGRRSMMRRAAGTCRVEIQATMRRQCGSSASSAFARWWRRSPFLDWREWPPTPRERIRPVRWSSRSSRRILRSMSSPGSCGQPHAAARRDGRIANAIGKTAEVYLTIPAHRAGKGKITVTVQNRTMEYEAETEFDALPTGSSVQIVAVVGDDAVAVIPASEPARTSHV